MWLIPCIWPWVVEVIFHVPFRCIFRYRGVMPVGRRGLVVPQNTFLENVIRRSNGLRKYSCFYPCFVSTKLLLWWEWSTCECLSKILLFCVLAIYAALSMVFQRHDGLLIEICPKKISLGFELFFNSKAKETINYDFLRGYGIDWFVHS